MQQLLESITKAEVNLERRMMEARLSGSEASRLVAAEVGDYSPYGAVDTWQCWHSYRRLEEIRSHWSVTCRDRGVSPTEGLWAAVVESGYQRAEEEQEPVVRNHLNEAIRLQDKIAFWRVDIPIAAGLQHRPNMLDLQRRLQVTPRAPGADPEVLHGDLVGWRQSDLQDWAAGHPAASATSS